MRMPIARRAAGFTLIELLVALTIAGLVSVALMGGLRFGLRAWEVGQGRMADQSEVEVVHALARRFLAQSIVPLADDSAPSDADPAFIGDADRVRLVAVVPAHVGLGGLYRIELAWRDALDGGVLALRWRLYRPDQERAFDDVFDEKETLVSGGRILLRDVAEAQFSYYGVDDRSRTAEWHEEWDSDAGLPELIALRVAFEEGSARRWPELVVSPRLRGLDAAR